MKEVHEILEDRRRKNELNLDKRKKHAYDLSPRLKEIDNLLKEKNISRITSALAGRDVEDLNKEIDNLVMEFNNILKSHDLPQDYLEMKYHCDICKDTGVDGTKICSCKRALMTQKIYEDTGISDILEVENFENFNLNLFRKNRQEGENMSPHDNMKSYKEQLEQYATHFDSDSVNLYIFGNVGTGKTYLLNSIAKRVLDNGFSVVYLSESDLVNTILDHRFAYSENKANLKQKVDAILDCDLLIIDDLGTNMINDATRSAIFEAINSRLVKKNPVVISSNLDPNDISDYYDSRIYSRIVGNYHHIKLFGNDVRMSL